MVKQILSVICTYKYSVVLRSNASLDSPKAVFYDKRDFTEVRVSQNNSTMIVVNSIRHWWQMWHNTL